MFDQRFVITNIFLCGSQCILCEPACTVFSRRTTEKLKRVPQREVTSTGAAKILSIIILFLLIPCIKVFPQKILCDNLLFEPGASILTIQMKNQVDQLLEKTRSIRRRHIGLTVWQNDDPQSISRTTLAENRMRNLFAYLIAKNCGNLVREIRIKPLKSDSLLRTDSLRQDNLIEFCILERFPDDNDILNDTILEIIRQVIPLTVIREPDTIIRGANGTLVRFQGRSLGPYKLSDFRYEIDEMFNNEAIGNNNMSTMTNTGSLIASFKAVRIWAIPLNPEIPVPASLQVRATILIPVDSAMNNTEPRNMLAFRPGKGSKSFITWSKSGDSLRVEMYGGRRYFMLQTDAMGYLAIGKLNQARTPFFVQIPRFRKIKITVKSDSDNVLAIFNDPDQRIIRLIPSDFGSDVLKDFSLTAEAVDNSGNLYVLNQTTFDRFINKKKKNSFEMRKKDFQKL